MQYNHSGREARAIIVSCLLFAGGMSQTLAAEPAAPGDPAVERGRYLVQISGCNDCHTPGYMVQNGDVPEALWLTGSPVGWTGPWGTTYASNLRLVADGLSETRWLKYARREWRPPMPFFNLRSMTDEDLMAIYRYLRHAGPAGEAMPAALPPGVEPDGPAFRAPSP